jgi:hypothetical protein
LCSRSTSRSSPEAPCRPDDLQPPSPPLSGSYPRCQPCTRTRRDLLHPVLTSPSSRTHRSIAGGRHLDRYLAGVDPAETLGEDLSQIFSDPSDRDPTPQIKSLIWNGMDRSGAFLSLLIQRSTELIHPNRYPPIRSCHVSAHDLNSIQTEVWNQI